LCKGGRTGVERLQQIDCGREVIESPSTAVVTAVVQTHSSLSFSWTASEQNAHAGAARDWSNDVVGRTHWVSAELAEHRLTTTLHRVASGIEGAQSDDAPGR
jgi:hypothetical protein